jgi:hypothetical protein
MGKRVRVMYRSLVSFVLAGIFVAIISGCNPPEKLSQAQENPAVQTPDSVACRHGEDRRRISGCRLPLP